MIMTLVSRILGVLALACGLIGLIAGLSDHTWKLGVTGWFQGGILLAILAVASVLDERLRLKGEKV